MSSKALPAEKVKIWDVPTRAGHWLLVLLFIGAWWTADNNQMYWHRCIGYGIAGFLIFRVYWGLFGSTTARFRHFLRGPSGILVYLRGFPARRGAPPPVGHNPLGGLSTVALLSVLLLQVVLGLFAVDVDGMEAGPLSFYISFEAGRDAAVWHERVFNLLLGFIGLHIIAVLFYWVVYRQNLIGRMIHGRDISVRPARPLEFAPVWRLILGLILAGLVVWYLKSLDMPL